MMRAHVVEDGVVINTIEVESLDFIPNLIDGEVGSIGWVWDGVNLVDPSAPSPEQLLEIQWANVRTERNKRLIACDWTQLPDAPVDTLAWSDYRQELRDITLQPDPFNIQWPEEPA